jgi:hypothetical protein
MHSILRPENGHNDGGSTGGGRPGQTEPLLTLKPLADPANRPEEYELLSPEQRAALGRWIGENIVPSRRPGKRTSYGLKHTFEDSEGGFYVNNGAFKGAMLAAGYAPVGAVEPNWTFRAELKSDLRARGRKRGRR